MQNFVNKTQIQKAQIWPFVLYLVLFVPDLGVCSVIG